MHVLSIFFHHLFSFCPILFAEKDENKRRSSKSPGIKCVVVGDGTAGKTNLIQSYLLDNYVHDSSYIPTAFDKYNGEWQLFIFQVKIDSQKMHLKLELKLIYLT